MSGKAWCQRHGAGFDMDTGCLDCKGMRDSTKAEPDPNPSDSDAPEEWFPATQLEFDNFVLADPFTASIMMDKKFGYTWRGMTNGQIKDMLQDHFRKKQSGD